MSDSKRAQARQYYSPDPQAQKRAFSRAVITAGGRTIWLAGQTASGPDMDFDSQVREVFAKLEATIKGAGGKGLNDMVTMTVFIKDARLGDRFVELRRGNPQGALPRKRAHHRDRLCPARDPGRGAGRGRRRRIGRDCRSLEIGKV
jgi:enamine deaminase RidA (YjgF/YER057c/UK114 family)